MASQVRPDQSTPEATVEAYLAAWRDGNDAAQWDLSFKVDADAALIDHHVTDAIVERWTRADFKEHFPDLKAKFYDRYDLYRTRIHCPTSERARVHYAARRKDSLLKRHLSAWMSRWAVIVALAQIFGIHPWYDALSYFDVVHSNGKWCVRDWRYYKY
ncbi:MAG: hypothetical protein JO083_11140 [Candidatus Eremiobacteraeota bacterium]|nr:hypothetical protein [Candidatus Eremiobacteraeota bacterium]